MIDIHNHLLPSVDDGSPSLEQSLDMAEMAVASGVRTIIVTPHCNIPGYFENYYTPEFRHVFCQFKNALTKAHIPLQIFPGMEVFADDSITGLIENGQVIGLNFSHYLLTEFDFAAHPDWITARLQSVILAGKTPVIAHPERYDCVQDAPYIAEHWLQSGCLLQCNKESFFGRFGRQAAIAAHFLMDHQMVSFIASDAHRATVRTPEMHAIYDYIADTYGDDTAHLLMQNNPAHICQDIPLATPDFIPYARTSYWEI